MSTKLVMTAAAAVLGALGIGFTFAPDEVHALIAGAPSAGGSIALQLTGALYLGFAMLDWTAKATLLGGIYGRPTVIGNLLHFTMGALALLKVSFATEASPTVLSLALLYTGFAVLFARMLFASPTQPEP